MNVELCNIRKANFVLGAELALLAADFLQLICVYLKITAVQSFSTNLCCNIESLTSWHMKKVGQSSPSWNEVRVPVRRDKIDASLFVEPISARTENHRKSFWIDRHTRGL